MLRWQYRELSRLISSVIGRFDLAHRFLRAAEMQARISHKPDVPSVRPSVKRVDCDKIPKLTLKFAS